MRGPVLGSAGGPKSSQPARRDSYALVTYAFYNRQAQMSMLDKRRRGPIVNP